jgi:type 1 glutamine amidotransferase
MKILLLCGDYYHPAQIPIEGTKQTGFDIDVITDTSEFDPAVIEKYNAVIMSKCDHVSQSDNTSWKTPKIQEAFVRYAENGGGLLVVHNGTVAGENTDMLDRLIGCRFKTHPDNCPVYTGVIKPHPVTEGVNMFCETDEHYQLEILADDIDILAVSFSNKQGDESKYESEPYFNAPACIAPSVYVRTQGKGRVCVLTPGHVLECWLNAEFQKLLINALKWCAKK